MSNGTETMGLLTFLLWIGFSSLVAGIAEKRGHPRILWFIASLLISPLAAGIAVLVFVPEQEQFDASLDGWHVVHNEERIGPMTGANLQSIAKKLRRRDKVWREGMKEWREVHTMRGLVPSEPPSWE
jgi:hypothetical protein